MICRRAIIIKIKQASMPSLPSVGEKALANLTTVKMSQPNGLNSFLPNLTILPEMILAGIEEV